MSFKKILGQHKAVNTLQGFLKSGRVPHAMIFGGPTGVGKAMSALEFAKTLNCLDAAARDAQDSCGDCINCKHIDARTHPDIIFADFAYQAALRGEEPEKQQTLRVDTVRALTAASQQRAALAKWKVYIIDAAEKMNDEAANALLKFIEEPPQNTVWILISAKREAMLATIKSRCQAVNFAPLGRDIIINILKDNFVEDDIAERSAYYGAGSTAKAMLAAQTLGDFAAMPAGAAFAPAAAMGLSKTLAQARAQAACAMDMLAVAAHTQWTAAAEADRRAALGGLLQKLNFYKRALNRNTSPALVLEAAIISAETCGVIL
ncbi:MAG: DNA polymerase III subunit delta' [Elusimicrobiota bacterium]|jgi:DNA polymerase-3 subunit delta'|nr:DNA polymerase III subunit delta' [Elusimicrobiota bacterium]